MTHCKTKVFSKSSKECKAVKNQKQKSQTIEKKSVNLKKLKKEFLEQRLRKRPKNSCLSAISKRSHNGEQKALY